MRIYHELKRRGVVRAAIAYVAFSWLLLQVAEVLLPIYGFGDQALRNIVSVLAIGFIPMMILSWVYEWTPQGLQKESDIDSDSIHEPEKSRGWNAAIIMVLLIAVTWFAIDKFVVEGTSTGRSIAVMAFDDLSPGGDHEYLADGVAAEIIDLLAPVDNLRVISRSSSFTFKHSVATAPEIADKLGVSHLLEGTVARQGDHVRIAAQLIDAQADRLVWSASWDRELDEIFAIQDEVASMVVEQLNVVLLGEAPTSRRIDENFYEDYLQARFLLHTMQSDSVDTLKEAEQLLEGVLAQVPGYLPAIREKGRVDFRLSGLGVIDNDELMARWSDALEKVEQAAPDSASVDFWRGRMAWVRDRDYQAAANHFSAGLKKAPNDVDWLRAITWFLIELEQFDDAIAVARRLVERDPACGTCVSNMAMAYRSVGRFEEGIETLQKLEVWRMPTDRYQWQLGTMELMSGQPEKAFESYKRIEDEDWRNFGLVLALHDLGRREEFDTLFKRIRDSGSPEAVARIYAWIGDSDQAFEWIELAVEQEGPGVLDELSADFYIKIKADSRWDELLRNHGIDRAGTQRVTFNLPAEFTGSE